MIFVAVQFQIVPDGVDSNMYPTNPPMAILGGDTAVRGSYCPHISHASRESRQGTAGEGVNVSYGCDDCATDFGDYEDPHEKQARENVLAGVGPVVISPQQEIVTDQETLQTFAAGDQNIEVLISQDSGEMQPLMILSTESLSAQQVCFLLFFDFRKVLFKKTTLQT